MGLATLVEPASIQRLTRDLRDAAETLTDAEARFLVDAYYMMQDQRIRSGNQIGSLAKSDEPHRVLSWFNGNAETLENQVKQALGRYAGGSLVGQWSLSLYGVGPVLAAGLLAHINIEKAPTVGHIWRFAGLDPTVRWGKGEKRPWNAQLKVICWKLGESFKKQSGREECYYGHLYQRRKQLEVERNEAGMFAEQAAATLSERPRHAQRAIYAEGKLPPGRLDLRATRYAVKLFLGHWHEAAYVTHYGTLPPKPFAIAHLGHAHEMLAPGMELVPGWVELRRP
jgi:hypothetical protein